MLPLWEVGLSNQKVAFCSGWQVNLSDPIFYLFRFPLALSIQDRQALPMSSFIGSLESLVVNGMLLPQKMENFRLFALELCDTVGCGGGSTVAPGIFASRI